MTGVPRPKAYHASTLELDYPPFRTALNDIKNMFKAFRRYSENVDVNLCSIQPMLGDFKLTDRQTGEDSHVEAKTYHCRLILDGSTRTLTLQHKQTAVVAKNDRAIFT